jgi:sporulation protein YlmC with PRC-barrel domain
VSDPVSWFVIEPGWKVVDAAGKEIGKVEEVVGDSEEDIFNGLAVSTRLLERPRYVPSERVQRITEGEITLSMTADELERMMEFREPPASLEIEGDKASITDRVADVFIDPESRPQPLTLWRRLLNRIFRR